MHYYGVKPGSINKKTAIMPASVRYKLTRSAVENFNIATNMCK